MPPPRPASEYYRPGPALPRPGATRAPRAELRGTPWRGSGAPRTPRRASPVPCPLVTRPYERLGSTRPRRLTFQVTPARAGAGGMAPAAPDLFARNAACRRAARRVRSGRAQTVGEARAGPGPDTRVTFEALATC